MTTKKLFWIKPGTLILAATAIMATSSLAQREPPDRQETREERRARMEKMAPEERQQFRQQRWQERLKSMTPEQRERFEAGRVQMEQFQRQQQIAAVSADERQRFLMQSAGVSEIAEQDALLAFAIELSQHRQPVTEAATQLSTLLGDVASSPEALSTQLTKLQTASKSFRTWKEGALKELDVKVNYSTNARMQSLLILVGILGDESMDAGGFSAIFPKGVAGTGDIIDLLPKMENQGWGGMGSGRGGRNGGQDAPADAPTPAN